MGTYTCKSGLVHKEASSEREEIKYKLRGAILCSNSGEGPQNGRSVNCPQQTWGMVLCNASMPRNTCQEVR